MVPLDRAMQNSYRLSTKVCSGLAAILNAELLLAAITHCRIVFSVDCSVRYSSVTIA